jgi:hypothetical protein
VRCAVCPNYHLLVVSKFLGSVQQRATAFRSVLRETHPDRAGAERSFTANEVAALLNVARAKFTGDAFASAALSCRNWKEVANSAL